jgi:hypothetical protein
MAQQPNVGLVHPVVDVSRPHINRHTHSHTVGLLGMRDQPVAEAATHTTHNRHKRRTSTPSAGFEPVILVIERPQT